ncbi:MAG: sigma-54-dependent Fis family transcriptional regulator [Candidatus Zixiibacteriota bacterium]|nr:MAG: sigma-54-dependent Fis family transcriptional regulator [candidate division Zixibacteria bacterium]
MADKILIVDDEPNITSSLASLLGDDGYRSEVAASAEQAADRLDRCDFSLVLLDLNLPGKSGIDLLREMKDRGDPTLVLVISGQADIPTALEAVRLGAVDYLEKPVAPEKLLSSVRSALLLAAANRQRTLMVDDLDSRSRIIGKSKAIRRLIRTIDQAAPADATVLINGENGTGKELVATRLYLQGRRRDKPFVKVNCPGIPETLFESELFGHIKGAFTGAVKDHPGKFAMADGGTIFLDEIGDLPRGCQAKLLRVLETGEVETLGAQERRTVDVRVICATNRDLAALIKQGRFREDLFYRISVLVIEVPPLRERLEDVPLLAGEFLGRFDPSGGTRLSAEALGALTTLDYPGNVRQLKNLIERITILCSGRTVRLEDILPHATAGRGGVEKYQGQAPLSERLRNFEKTLIKEALEGENGNIAAAARTLGMDRANLSKKIRDFGLK